MYFCEYDKFSRYLVLFICIAYVQYFYILNPTDRKYFGLFSSYSINRSFDLSIELKSEADILDEILHIIRKLDKSSFATLDEKFYTFILFALNRGKLHAYWKVLSDQGEFVKKKNN